MRRRAVLRSFGTVATVGVAGLSGVTAGIPDDLQWATTSRATDVDATGDGAPDSDSFTRRLAVPVRGQTETFTLDVPRSLYDHFADRPRRGDYLSYATATGNAAVVAPVADAVSELVGVADDATLRRAVTGLVQHVPYVSDAAAGYDGEYPKYPVETLVDEAGDCEDSAALLAALLDHLGYDVALLALWEANHMAVGVAGCEGAMETPYVADGTAYRYQETVEPGWALGDVPSNYAGEDADILPLPAGRARS